MFAVVIGAELARSDALATKKKGVTESQELYRDYLVVDPMTFLSKLIDSCLVSVFMVCTTQEFIT